MARTEPDGALVEAIRAAATELGGGGAAFEPFAQRLLRDVPPRALRTLGARELTEIARACFAFAGARKPGERLVSLPHQEPATGRTAILVLQEDRPFLVDTLRLFLRRHDLREDLLLHPILPLRRAPDGSLLAVDAEGGSRESLIYALASPGLDEARRERCEEDLRAAMESAAFVTGDHLAMLRATRALGERLQRAAAHVPGGGERIAKICRFLRWLEADHFVFMGVRRYRVAAEDDALEVSLLAGSGLGIWRREEESRFHHPVRGEDVPAGLRRALEDARIIQIGKGFRESHVHRGGRIDRIVVKEHDEFGRLRGFTLLSGLFTFRALRTPSSAVPLLAERLEQILAEEGAAPGSHREKAMVAAFDSAPVEFLLGADIEDNAALIREIVDAEGAEDARLVLRSDPGGTSFYAGVLVPRARYSEELRVRVRRLLEERAGVVFVDDRASFLEDGGTLLHYFCTARGGEPPAADALETEIRALAARWEDQLADALIASRGRDAGRRLADRWAGAFAEPFQLGTHPWDAVRDVEALEALEAHGEPQLALFFDRRTDGRDTTALRLYLREPRLLSELLPVIDQFGIGVVDSRQSPVTPPGREPLVVHQLRVLPLGGVQDDLDALAPRLADAVRATLVGRTAADPLNGLVLGAGLDWRQVDLVRSYVEYHQQIQGTLTRPFVWRVLLENPLAVRLLIRYHAARLRPGPGEEERSRDEEELRQTFARYRDRVTTLNEDRALGALYELIDATLRTSFFAEPDTEHRIAWKLDPSRLEGLAPPQPHREIFVHASGVDGVHLRGGPVARGGLRWSDRLDDFRTEVLGLMRTQMLKNGLIVPVGAKGGFVLRRAGLSASEARREADRQYRVFVSGLLDLTDDVDADGRVVTPPGVFPRDGADPYLVVAADKGTAHLSDAANEIARARGFWLGDAFASGGSEGYDHKRYGITARGAWECVRHHFAELGIDPERDSYRVAGIGDMSGDVFGNGLLLMRNARLQAAFDHRHVFLDPDPDAERSYSERARLFALPSSSWDDYDRACLSPGGGVFPRSAKAIPLSPEARALLGLETDRATGPEVVAAILRLPVDLLWNGGIGTYVKATHESHVEVGDRANDSVRIDAPQLRARVVGEGGNLGLTQAARIQAARGGVRLDSDAIHNSAGVDLSDHEVNFKILLAPEVRSGKLSPQARHEALFAVVQDACRATLSHNRAQALAISLDERRARRDPQAFAIAADLLAGAVGADARELGLPDDEERARRRESGEALFRPELAVLLGLAKLHARGALADSELVDQPEHRTAFEDYFPKRLRAERPTAPAGHRLRREITALQCAQRVVDAGGATALTSLVAHRGVPVEDAAGALLLADAVADAPRYRAEFCALPAAVPRDTVYEALIALDDAVHDLARSLLAAGIVGAGARLGARWRDRLQTLRAHLRAFLSAGEAELLAARAEALRARGLPGPVADDVASFPLADRGLDVLRVSDETGMDPVAVARVYAAIGDRTGINWVYQSLPGAPAADVWDRVVLADLRSDLLSLQRQLAERVLRDAPEDPDREAEAFLDEHAPLLARVHALQQTAQPSTSALAVVARALLTLRR